MIATQFHALDDVGWYGSANLMTLTAKTPIAANIYKYFDPKTVYLASVVVFESTFGLLSIAHYYCQRL